MSARYNRAYYQANREKLLARSKAWQAANPEKARAANRRSHRKRLGNPAQDVTGESPTGPCEICGRVRQLHWDHNHETGAFRGWLCVACNTKLGWFEKHQQKVKEYLCQV